MLRIYNFARIARVPACTVSPLSWLSVGYKNFGSCAKTKPLLPLGFENFRDVVDMKLDFVDKSMFIAEVLDDKATFVAVITRPRRFGKTLNLSMLRHFLAAKVNGLTTSSLFNNLKIAQPGLPYMMQHQGKYPVIFLTLKELKFNNYEDTYCFLKSLIAKVFREYYYLLESDKLIDVDKDFIRKIIGQKADKISLMTSFQNLTEYLYLHHGVKPWLLIDEYDTPLYAAFMYRYYDEMIGFLQPFLGNVLTTNKYLYKSVVTGILRIAKGSVFSDMNHVTVYSLLQNEYSEHFGFTEEEVIQTLKRSNLANNLEEVREWYNGYNAGNSVVYNPWSIINYCKSEGRLGLYWINTSDNKLIRKTIFAISSKGRLLIKL